MGGTELNKEMGRYKISLDNVQSQETVQECLGLSKSSAGSEW